VLLARYHSGDEIKKNEIGEQCSMYGGEEKYMQGLLGGEA
jgi:hypothetical protein